MTKNELNQVKEEKDTAVEERKDAVVSESEHGKRSLGNVVSSYFGNSYLNAVSSLVKEEKISIDELKNLIDLVEKQK